MAEMIDILNRLLNENKNVNSAIVSSSEGFLIEGVTTDGNKNLEALSAEIIPHIDETIRLSDYFRFGELNLAMVEFDNGTVLVARIGDEAIMIVSIKGSGSLGKLRIQMKKAIAQIAELI